MNENLANYPEFHNDIDDPALYSYETFERFKQFRPKKGSTVGSSTMIPMEDND